MNHNKYDIYFYEAFEEETLALKKYLPSSVKAGFTWKTIQESGHKTAPAEYISSRTQSSFPAEWAGSLKAILSRSTGYNHLLNYKEQIENKIEFGYLPLYCNRAVAEQALTLWMSLLRKLPMQTEQFQHFKRDGLTGKECIQKNLLVVGVGNIGYELIKIGRGLSMNTEGVDIEQKYSDVLYISIDEGLKKADIIVASMNLTSQNRNYFDYNLLKKSKKGVLFINVARGELSPLKDIKKLLDEGVIGALGMDVFEDEGLVGSALRGSIKGNPEILEIVNELKERSNVIFTPHNAFNTIEAVERKSKQSVEQILSFLKNGKFIWPIPVE